MRSFYSLTLLTSACVFIDSNEHQKNLGLLESAEYNEKQTQDNDEDGYIGADDCNDTDPEVALAPECEDLDIKFEHIEPQQFNMGSDPGTAGHQESEVQHKVTLNRSFYMMDAELTNAQYAFYNDIEAPDEDMAMLPKVQLTWNMAAHTANQMSEEEGLDTCYECNEDLECESSEFYSTLYDCPGYRLPTEAEWAYASRSTTDASFWFISNLRTGATMAADFNPVTQINNCQEATMNDDTILDEVGIYCGSDPAERQIGRTRRPNGFYLYDLHGNVAEWVQDSMSDYTNALIIDPITDEGGARKRMVRGGSFKSKPKELRSFDRQALNADQEYDDVGVRYVRTASWPDI